MGKSKKTSTNSDSRPPVEFRGDALELMHYQGDDAIISGPAGTGKSMACLWKLHLICESKPGVRALMIRKTRSSLTQSAMVTFETKVLGPKHVALAKGGLRRMRSEYNYGNGSVIVLGGMDEPTKVMSTEYDLIFVQEAIELRENEWESLKSRLRNGQMGYQQIFGDTNPDHPQHWIMQRARRGDTKLFESHHEDNPRFWDKDKEKGEWTEEGASYLAKLDSLRGAIKDRLRYGKWSEASGCIYVDWRRDIHLVSRRAIPAEWKRIWAVDFGFRNPFVCLMAAVDPDGRIIVYREIYQAKKLVEDHAADMLELLEEEARFWANKRNVPFESMKRQISPAALICDHDAGDRAVLERHLGLSTVSAKKNVTRGIQVVSERLRVRDDGRPSLEIMDHSLFFRDQELAAQSKPTSILEEFPSYTWRPGVKDEPIKEDDHGMDAIRYLCMYEDRGSHSVYETPVFVEPVFESVQTGGGIRRPDGESRIRYGERMDRERRGGKLFGGGA